MQRKPLALSDTMQTGNHNHNLSHSETQLTTYWLYSGIKPRALLLWLISSGRCRLIWSRLHTATNNKLTKFSQVLMTFCFQHSYYPWTTNHKYTVLFLVFSVISSSSNWLPTGRAAIGSLPLHNLACPASVRKTFWTRERVLCIESI